MQILKGQTENDVLKDENGEVKTENAENDVKLSSTEINESGKKDEQIDKNSTSKVKSEQKNSIAENRTKKDFFSASKIAKLAIFSALAFVVTFLEFPIFPAAPFLKLDFANVFIMLSGFMFGPVSAIIVSFIKELLSLLKSSTGGVGEIANFVMTLSFVLVPSTVYRYKKGIRVVIFCFIVATFLQSGVALLANRFINFPLFMGDGAAAAFSELWIYVFAFNIIKGVAISIVTLLLYKRISWLLNKF